MTYNVEGHLHVRQRFHVQKRGYRTLNVTWQESHITGKTKQAAGQRERDSGDVGSSSTRITLNSNVHITC